MGRRSRHTSPPEKRRRRKGDTNGARGHKPKTAPTAQKNIQFVSPPQPWRAAPAPERARPKRTEKREPGAARSRRRSAARSRRRSADGEGGRLIARVKRAIIQIALFCVAGADPQPCRARGSNQKKSAKKGEKKRKIFRIFGI